MKDASFKEEVSPLGKKNEQTGGFAWHTFWQNRPHRWKQLGDMNCDEVCSRLASCIMLKLHLSGMNRHEKCEHRSLFTIYLPSWIVNSRHAKTGPSWALSGSNLADFLARNSPFLETWSCAEYHVVGASTCFSFLVSMRLYDAGLRIGLAPVSLSWSFGT